MAVALSLALTAELAIGSPELASWAAGAGS